MIRTQATTVSLCTSRPATRSYRTSMLFSSTVRAAGIGACQKRILGSVLQGSIAPPRQCGSSRPPGSNSQPGSRAPGRNRPLCRRPPKLPRSPPLEQFHPKRVGAFTPVPTRNDGPMTPRTATLIGLTAILMWSLLSVLTVATGKVPAFQLAAMTFAIGALVGSLTWIGRTDAIRALRQQPTAWIVGAGGLFGYHALYVLALRFAPPAEAGRLNYLWP